MRREGTRGTRGTRLVTTERTECTECTEEKTGNERNRSSPFLLPRPCVQSSPLSSPLPSALCALCALCALWSSPHPSRPLCCAPLRLCASAVKPSPHPRQTAVISTPPAQAAPVTYDASSEARKPITTATSAAHPGRPSKVKCHRHTHLRLPRLHNRHNERHDPPDTSSTSCGSVDTKSRHAAPRHPRSGVQSGQASNLHNELPQPCDTKRLTVGNRDAIVLSLSTIHDRGWRSAQPRPEMNRPAISLQRR